MKDSINLAPEAPMLTGADQLGALFERYVATKRRQIDEKTVQLYTWKLRHFREWWDVAGPAAAWTLTPDLLTDFNEHLDTYISARTGNHLAYHTKRDALRRLAGFLRWAYQNDYTKADWSKYVPEPHGKPPLFTPMALDDLDAIYTALRATSTGTRDAALFAVLAGTGMRRGECLALNFDDVSFLADMSGTILIRQSKGKQQRRVAFDGTAGRVIHRHHKTGDGPAPMWPNEKTGERLSYLHLGRLIVRAAENVDVDFGGCHDIRRAFATYWARQLPGDGYGQLLSKEMGHSVKGMTFGRYVLTDMEDVRRCMVEKQCSLFAQMRVRMLMESEPNK